MKKKKEKKSFLEPEKGSTTCKQKVHSLEDRDLVLANTALDPVRVGSNCVRVAKEKKMQRKFYDLSKRTMDGGGVGGAETITGFPPSMGGGRHSLLRSKIGNCGSCSWSLC